MTFNSANKFALGIADTYASGVLCDALGAGTPIIAVPMVNDRLWGHPRWRRTLEVLVEAGVVLLDPSTGRSGTPHPVASGAGADVVEAFDPGWLYEYLPDPR